MTDSNDFEVEPQRHVPVAGIVQQGWNMQYSVSFEKAAQSLAGSTHIVVLPGSAFKNVDLSGSTFHGVNPSGCGFEDVNLGRCTCQQCISRSHQDYPFVFHAT